MEWKTEMFVNYDPIDAAYIFKSLIAVDPTGDLREATIETGGEMVWMEWAWKRAILAAVAIQNQIFEQDKGELFQDLVFAYDILEVDCDLIQQLRHCWDTPADLVVQDWLKDYEEAKQTP